MARRSAPQACALLHLTSSSVDERPTPVRKTLFPSARPGSTSLTSSELTREARVTYRLGSLAAINGCRGRFEKAVLVTDACLRNFARTSALMASFVVSCVASTMPVMAHDWYPPGVLPLHRLCQRRVLVVYPGAAG